MQLAEVSPGSIGIGGIWQLQRSQAITIRLQNFGLPEFQFTGIDRRSHPPECFLRNLSQAKHCKSTLVWGFLLGFLMHFSSILAALLVSHVGLLAAIYNVYRLFKIFQGLSGWFGQIGAFFPTVLICFVEVFRHK